MTPYARAGEYGEALARYLRAAAAFEHPTAGLCLKLARLYHRQRDAVNVRHWLMRVVDGGDDFVAWQGAAALARRVCRRELARSALRQSRHPWQLYDDPARATPAARLTTSRGGAGDLPSAPSVISSGDPGSREWSLSLPA